MAYDYMENEIRQYSPFENHLPFYLEEGDVTVADVEVAGGTTKAAMYEKPLVKGDYVTLSDKDFIVRKAEEGDIVIGQIHDNPAAPEKRVKESIVSANAPKRMATIRLFGCYPTSLTYVNDAAAIEVGDSVVYAGDNKFKKADSANNTLVLEASKPLTEGKFLVLTGAFGVE